MQSLMAENNRIIKPLQVILIVMLMQIVVAFFTDPMMFTFDESMWQYIGRNWIRNSMVPYSGGVDNKSPLIFLIFGISDRLFGANYWFPRLLGTLVQSAGIYFLFKIAERTINTGAGIFAISFYGLSLLWHSTGGKYVSYTETYAVACIVISIYFGIVSEKKSFAAGLFAGLGFAFRFTAVFGILPLVIFSFKKKPEAALIFLLGALTSIALLLMVAGFSGIRINEFLFYGLTDNFGTGSTTAHSLNWEIHQMIHGFFYSGLLLFYPGILVYFILNKKLDFPECWFISELVGVVVLRAYDNTHFKDLLPAMSLMNAFVANRLVENYHISGKKILLGSWLLFFPKTFEPFVVVKKLLIPKSRQSASDQSAALSDEGLRRMAGIWVRSNTSPGEKVFIAGYGAQVQVYAERLSPSIYFNASQTGYAKRQLFSDLNSEKPDMMLIPLSTNYGNAVDTSIRMFVSDLVKKNYRLDTSVYSYNIFRLNKKDIP
jgi:hypothetical protein